MFSIVFYCFSTCAMVKSFVAWNDCGQQRFDTDSNRGPSAIDRGMLARPYYYN